MTRTAADLGKSMVCQPLGVYFDTLRLYGFAMSFIPDSEVCEAARQALFAVTLHMPEDFEGMRRAGRLAAEVLDMLVPEVKPGGTTAHIDKLAYDYVVARGAAPACLGYRGYRHTVCTSIT